MRAACAALALFVSGTAAAEEASDVDPTAIQVHGFVSQGFIKSNHNNYLAASERGSLEFTEVGLNFTKQLSDNLRVGLQLFTHDLGPLGNYSPQFDWFYLNYRFADWFGIRAGRTKIPFGLYNESNDVDSSRVPILLPQSLYPVDHRDYLLAQTGGEAYGHLRLSEAGALDYRAYGGTIFLTPTPPAAGVTLTRFEVPYVVGGRILWQTPVPGLVAGGSYQALRLDAAYSFDPAVSSLFQMLGYLPAGLQGALPVKFRVKLWVLSLEYTYKDLQFAAEYGRWIGDFESRAPLIFPPHTVNERYYAMASYRVANWFTPVAYYSVYYPNVEKRDGPQSHQRDFAVSLRYDLNANWLLKLEGHVMNGTAALDSSLNDGKDVKNLTRNWGVFLAKLTAYF